VTKERKKEEKKKKKKKEKFSPFTEDYHWPTWRLSLRAMIPLSMPA
jgi:hypothetical protein